MPKPNLQVITLAGGCFWCTEAVFQRLKGVQSVTSGYANSQTPNPSYEEVRTGHTNAAEAVQVKFDPEIISLAKLLDIFWAVHDPTSLNRQGNDVGTDYRSAIFYENDELRVAAEKSKDQFQSSGALQDRNIVTEISPLENFQPAESYHQNYYEQNRHSNPYCPLVITPKIHKLLEKFNSEVKDEYKQEP